jgi:hypothetical protein
MVNEERTSIDPLGNVVFIVPGICAVKDGPDAEIYDDVAIVIQKPALFIEVASGISKEFYYFRSVGWNNTMLITARFQHERWEACACVKNPPNDDLAQLLKKGKQLI